MPFPAITPELIAAALLALLPLAIAGWVPARIANSAPRGWAGLVLPALLCLPYLLIAVPARVFAWRWLALYISLPIAVAAALRCARHMDPPQHGKLIRGTFIRGTFIRGTWIDYAVLLVLGLAVDLRWFEPAWPPHLAAFNKILLLDAGIYGMLAVRQLEGVGFSLRIRLSDLRAGLRELAFYAPIAIPLGLALGFLHLHRGLPSPGHALFAWCFTFVLIAIPEELFFRGWVQNLLERRIGRPGALAATAVLFGLSHFNKRAPSFNWRYVILAAIAGIFYGRAWRAERRVAASAITHASVDTLWSLFLR
ncbi:MAG TPA: CPBP family intramembrane glutamic endopeptidase [Acidobacteriaceae bacterium]|nr:CPBP family intramembrane glutamic endopeptidase [Acidobacteriaceae bacterium]